MTRKGLLGGTFDPPHMAHLIVAHVVRESMRLDEVVLMPTSTHAFKGEPEVGARHRMTMVELAIAGDDGLRGDRLEVDRGGTSYTVETLEALKEREPDTAWSLILGWDNLAELEAWHQVERLPQLATIVVTSRGERGISDAFPALPFGEKPERVEVPALGISSSQIRERVREGRTIRYWVPAAVEAYVRQNGLYASAERAGR